MKKRYELSFNNLQSLIIAGIPGAGKTQTLFYLLLNEILKHSPQQMRVAYIDFKPLDSAYLQGLPHLVAPIATKPEQATALIEFVRREIDRRKESFLTTLKRDNWYQLILVIDELREVILLTKGMAKELASINALGRQYGVYLLCATQYPKAELLTSDLLACFASRVCLKVDKSQESKTIMDETGAELLKPHQALIKANKLPGMHLLKFSQSAQIKLPIIPEKDLPKLVKNQIALHGECCPIFSNDSPCSANESEFAEQIEMLKLHFKPGEATHKKVYEKLVELTGTGVGTRGKKAICESLNQGTGLNGIAA